MQKVVKEYSPIVWTDESVKEFANDMMKQTIEDLRSDNDYEFTPCLDVDLESFNADQKADSEMFIMSLEDTDTICVLIKGCKYVVAYDGDKCVIVSHTGIDIAETYGDIRNHARNYMKESNNNCWRAKSHAEAMEWLMKKE